MLETIINSLAFGLIAMVLVGGSWTLVGLVMGDAPKKGVDSSVVQFFGGFIPIIVGLIILSCQKYDFGLFSFKTLLLTSACYWVGGFANFFMLENMSKAMQRGPNGIIWSIIQSAMVFPFIVGIVFFGAAINVFRIVGIIGLLTALVLFGMGKNNVSNGKSWKLLTFLGLAICAFQQTIMTIPLFYEEARHISSIHRTTMVAIGTVIAAIVLTLFKQRNGSCQKILDGIKNLQVWKYVLILQGFNLFFAYIFLYPGMNVLGAKGLGGMCYPLLVGSCITIFTLTSCLFLREKLQKIQLIALIFCILGLLFICL